MLKAIILAGGKGTRLKPITHCQSKSLFPIANKPILFYAIESIVKTGVKEIGIIISPETGEAVKEAVGDGSRWGVEISYILQRKPLGLAHAVQVAEDWLNFNPFIMYLGDNLIKDDLTMQVHDFLKGNYSARISLKKVDNPSQFGVAEVDENGKAVRLVEKPAVPKSNLALVGIYIFDQVIHDAIDHIKPSGRGELEITDAIQWLIDNGHNVQTGEIKDYWFDLGKSNSILEANQIVLTQMLENDSDEKIKESYKWLIITDNKLEGKIRFGDGRKFSKVSIRGPVIIGDNVELSNCYIGPYTSVGNNVKIVNSEVENCIIQESVQIENICGKIESSLIGRNSQLIRGQTKPVAHKFMLGDDSKVEVI